MILIPSLPEVVSFDRIIRLVALIVKPVILYRAISRDVTIIAVAILVSKCVSQSSGVSVSSGRNSLYERFGAFDNCIFVSRASLRVNNEVLIVLLLSTRSDLWLKLDTLWWRYLHVLYLIPVIRRRRNQKELDQGRLEGEDSWQQFLE